MGVLAAARVVTAERVHSPGWVEHAGGRIVAVGWGPRPDARLCPPGATIVPGFVDMHVHGGGGGSYTALDAASVRRARAAHLAHGTTATVASLVTAAPEPLLASVRMLAELAEEGTIDGIHLEGPWISPLRRGAHDAAALRAPDPPELQSLLAAGRGALRMVTLAPELPGALAAIRQLTDAGVVGAVGHTDAGYEEVLAAVRAGASVGTHLFNAMRPVHHREPGPALALLDSPEVTVELIADGVHVHPAVHRQALRLAGAGRVALVSDAMEAAGLGDGEYRLGELAVAVRSGVARLAGADTIAGGTATMDALFRAALAVHEGSPGRQRVPAEAVAASEEAWRSAVRQTATTPARTLGWDHVGDLLPGRRADFVVLDEQAQLLEVFAAGVSVGPGRPAVTPGRES